MSATELLRRLETVKRTQDETKSVLVSLQQREQVRRDFELLEVARVTK